MLEGSELAQDGYWSRGWGIKPQKAESKKWHCYHGKHVVHPLPTPPEEVKAQMKTAETVNFLFASCFSSFLNDLFLL